jgi:hypothetical protein
MNWFWKKKKLEWSDVNWESNYVQVFLNPYPKAYSSSSHVTFTSTSPDWWHATNKPQWLEEQKAEKAAVYIKKQLEQELFYGKSANPNKVWWSGGISYPKPIPNMTDELAHALNNAV